MSQWPYAGYKRYNPYSQSRKNNAYKKRRMVYRSAPMQRWARTYGGGARGSRYGRNPALRNLRTGGLLGIETKFLDVGVAETAILAPTDAAGGSIAPTTGCTGCLTAPAQGDSASERDGQKIVVKSCLMQGTISVAVQADQTATDLSPTVYVALVQDTQTNAAAFNSSSVYTNPRGDASLAAQPFRNMANTARFKILKSKVIHLRMPPISWDGTNIEQAGFEQPITLSWRGMMPVQFGTGTSADIANVTNNSIQVVAFCTNTTLAPKLSYNARIRFIG